MDDGKRKDPRLPEERTRNASASYTESSYAASEADWSWESQNSHGEKDWEDLLQERLAELPVTEDVIHAVTPWRRAMKRILWGIALTTVTFSFLKLEVVLPAIGYLLLLFGFRMLWKENKWFRRGYGLSVLRLLLVCGSIMLRVTPWFDSAEGSLLNRGMTGMGILLSAGVLLSLWQGIRQIQTKAGQKPYAGSAFWMLIWYLTITVVAVLGIGTSLIFWILLIGYGMILYSIYTLSKDMDEVGYAIETAPLRVPEWAIAVGCGAVMLLWMLVCQTFFARYPMDWGEVSQTVSVDAEQNVLWTEEQRQLQEIRDHLIRVGMPEQVAADLSEEELRQCQDAVVVKVETEDFCFMEWRQEKYRLLHGSKHNYLKEEREAFEKATNDMRITSAAVQLDPQGEYWRVIHHFQWMLDTEFCGTEAMKMTPTYRQPQYWELVGEVTGRVLYDRAGKTYAAPYYSMAYGSGFEEAATDLYVTFSFPAWGQNQRGYLSYVTKDVDEHSSLFLNTILYYSHQTARIVYPYQTAEEFIRSKGYYALEKDFEHRISVSHITYDKEDGNAYTTDERNQKNWEERWGIQGEQDQ